MDKIKEIFGAPNEGIHAHRIFGVAAVDLLLTMVLAVVISLFSRYSAVTWFILLMVLAVALHRIFKVNTALNVKLFGVV